MSDDLSKRGSEAGGTESSPEYDQHEYKHLDRDQWYDDDEETNPPVADEHTEAAASIVTPDEEEEFVEAASSSADDVSNDSVSDATSTTSTDPYDFGTAPETDADPHEDVVIAEPDPPFTEAESPEPSFPDAVVDSPEPAVSASANDGQALPTGLASIGAGWNKRIGSVLGRFVNPVEDALKPTGALVATTTQRVIVGAAIAVALISLLGDNAAFALMVLGFALPLVIVLSILRQDVFESEPPLILLGVGGVGLIAGLLLGGLGSWVLQEQWFDNGTLNYGAAGFGGIYADRAGNAGFLIWLVNGLVLPLVSLAAIIAVPIALRRYAQFRNEIMDGSILGAIGAAGFAIGSGIIFLSPGVSDGLPRFSVSDWTLTTVAIVAVRPTILTLGGAMLGIAIWRYMRDADVYGMILPAVGSVGAWLLLALGTIQLQTAGVSVEFLWNLLIAIAVFIIYKRVIIVAIAIDRAALGAGGGRIVCPHCRKVTPAGAFCASCGKSLD